MAIKQDFVDRTKAIGFYRYVEWNSAKGVLVKVYDADANRKVKTTFEKCTIDTEYDQRLPGFRQFYLSRRDTVKFMLNMGMQTVEIARTFQLIDGDNIVSVNK